jgi:hypothetical protein
MGSRAAKLTRIARNRIAISSDHHAFNQRNTRSSSFDHAFHLIATRITRRI